jgi:hypothetical protein
MKLKASPLMTRTIGYGNASLRAIIASAVTAANKRTTVSA